MIYRCPKCQSALQMREKAFVCENNHSYDIAREGYVNLILSNQKKSLNSGDNKEMILSRANFLEAGNYDFLLAKVVELIRSELKNDTKNLPSNKTQSKIESQLNILDIGCGSGYYLSQMQKSFASGNFWGSDVSKAAIALCAKKYKNLNFAVGNSFDLPFIDQSLDCVISIFSPFQETEIERILRDDGIFIMVRPSANHLQQIYEKLAMPRKSKKQPIFANLNLTQNPSISQTAKIDKLTLQSLIQMTPLFFKIPIDIQIDIQNSLSIKEITYSFDIYVYRKRS